jgi:membrane protein YqaA with SNARE-associated domain
MKPALLGAFSDLFKQPGYLYCVDSFHLMQAWLDALLALLALPQYGLSTLFIAAFVSATLLPVGSEPILFGLLKLNPEMFWPAILVATVGNTLGGAVDWWIGYGAHKVADKYSHSKHHVRVLSWLERLGPKACLLSWLPIVGDPLCAVAGWLKLPFWPCLGYMVIGKFLRYVCMTVALLYIFPG